MTDESANPILDNRRKFERKLEELRRDMREATQSVNRRLSNFEQGQAPINRRLDRLDERETRIDRLDPVEG